MTFTQLLKGAVLRWVSTPVETRGSRQAQLSADALWTPKVLVTSSGYICCAQTDPIEYWQVQERRKKLRVENSHRIRGQGGSYCKKSTVVGVRTRS